MNQKSKLELLAESEAAQEAATLAQEIQIRENSYEQVEQPQEDANLDQFDAFLHEYVGIELKEDEIRYKLANNEKLTEKWAHCTEIFTAFDEVKEIEPASCAVYFDKPATHGIVTKEEFLENFNTFTNNIFDNVNTSNFIVAGGAVLSCLLPNCTFNQLSQQLQNSVTTDLEEEKAKYNAEFDKYENLAGLNGFYTSDIDLFIYGLNKEQADERVKEIMKELSAKNGFSVVSESSQAITLLGYQKRDIQIVFRLYEQPAEVLLGFDIDCAAVCYDFDTVYACDRALFAIMNRVNTVNQKRRSLNYAQRLIKYGRRGFKIAVPGFSRQFLCCTKTPELVFKHRTDELLHTRCKSEQLLLEAALSKSQNITQILPGFELNRVIEADMCEFCDLGIESTLYSEQLRQVIIISRNAKIENKMQNLELTAARRGQIACKRAVRESRATISALVEGEGAAEGAAGNGFVVQNLDLHQYDVLSYEFDKKSDYCEPVSFGFHSESALLYKRENPKQLENLFIGEFDAAKALTFVTENPGKEDLFTSSFHPENSFGYYGDLRVFFGANAFRELAPRTGATETEKIFFLTHFCSPSASLVAGYEKGRAEKADYEHYSNNKQKINALLQGENLRCSDLYGLEKLLTEQQELIERCISLCEERQVLAAKPLEISENMRQMVPWSWYIEDIDGYTAESVDPTQWQLLVNLREQIRQCKISGNNMPEYLANEQEIEAQLESFGGELSALYEQIKATGVGQIQLFGKTLSFSNERYQTAAQQLQQTNLLEKVEISLFEVDSEKLNCSYEENRKLLEVNIFVDLATDELLTLMRNRISESVIDFAQLELMHDFSWLKISLKLQNIIPFSDAVTETASYGTLQLLYQQFSKLVAEKEVSAQNLQTYVYNNELLYINVQERILDALSAENVDSYMVNELGLQENLIESVKAMPEIQNVEISVPILLIREQNCRRNREYYSDLEIDVESLDLNGLKLPMRIVKSSSQQLSVKCDGKLIPTYQYIQMLIDAFAINQHSTSYDLFLFGKTVAYALQNSINVDLSTLPMCVFRAYLNGQMPQYSRYEADSARFDLTCDGIGFAEMQESEVNGFKFTRAELGDDGFDAFLANEQAAKWKKFIAESLSGFMSMNGINGYSMYNAGQLKTLLCGK